jgi:hypothetical protein
MFHRMIQALEYWAESPNLGRLTDDWLAVVLQPPAVGVVDQFLELHMFGAIGLCPHDEGVGERNGPVRSGHGWCRIAVKGRGGSSRADDIDPTRFQASFLPQR